MVIATRRLCSQLRRAPKKRNDRQDQKDDEQHLRNVGGNTRNDTEAEDSRNDRNYQENQRVMEHGKVLLNESRSVGQRSA